MQRKELSLQIQVCSSMEHVLELGRHTRIDFLFLSDPCTEEEQEQTGAGQIFLLTASPIVDAKLADGSRANIVLAPVALNGPIVTIRKFPKESITMQQLMDWQSISPEAVDFLSVLVTAGYNIFISGGTGSGKTTFLNALSQYIPKRRSSAVRKCGSETA